MILWGKVEFVTDLSTHRVLTIPLKNVLYPLPPRSQNT